MSNKGFDFVTVAALVATLEEENASFEQAAEAHKASAAVVEERRKRVADLQMKIDKALSVLKTSPVWGTPWHDAQQREAELQDRSGKLRQQAQMLQQLQAAGNQALLSDPKMQQAAQNIMNQLAQQQGNAAQNAHSETMRKMAPPPPPLSGGAFKPWE